MRWLLLQLGCALVHANPRTLRSRDALCHIRPCAVVPSPSSRRPLPTPTASVVRALAPPPPRRDLTPVHPSGRFWWRLGCFWGNSRAGMAPWSLREWAEQGTGPRGVGGLVVTGVEQPGQHIAIQPGEFAAVEVRAASADPDRRVHHVLCRFRGADLCRRKAREPQATVVGQLIHILGQR